MEKCVGEKYQKKKEALQIAIQMIFGLLICIRTEKKTERFQPPD
jgi:hypothetical protein